MPKLVEIIKENQTTKSLGDDGRKQIAMISPRSFHNTFVKIQPKRKVPGYVYKPSFGYWHSNWTL